MAVATSYSFRQEIHLRCLANMVNSDDLCMCLGTDAWTTSYARLMNQTFDIGREI